MVRWQKQCRLSALAAITVGAVIVGALPKVSAQDQSPVETSAGEAAVPEENLSEIEARLADRYARLESSIERLADLSRSTQPRRAALLRQLIARSRERDVTGQFEKVVADLERESYSSAIDGQASLETELNKLLELLLQEDRDRQIDSQRKRIGRYVQEVNRLIRLQRGVKARTDGEDDPKDLAEDQQAVVDRTKSLGDDVESAEATEAKSSGAPESSSDDAESEKSPSSGEQRESESNNGESKNPSDSEKPVKKPEESESPSENERPAGADQSKSSEEKPSESKPAESAPSEQSGSPGEQGNPASGSPSSEPTPESPMQRAAQKLRQAQQQMEQARQKLDEAQREGAEGDQAKAIEELEQAKAEFERILRQLREEELERMLVLLEARFRKMLDQQVEVYEETKKLDGAKANVPPHELEIAAGRLSRKETLIVREADRALILLREDGTSTAFPEAIEQARDDMQAISDRLRETRVDLITQGLEEDVIAALEESLAALQQALKELRDQKGNQQSGQGQAQPDEKPLVDQLAELRMIRSLQVRVNRRTQQYGAMIEGEQAEAADILEALEELALRQQKIFQATRELNTKEN
jgi:hypothetical protein